MQENVNCGVQHGCSRIELVVVAMEIAGLSQVARKSWLLKEAGRETS